MTDKTDQEQQSETVGYCNPPQRTRFKPGISGNLRGRPKGTLNMATTLNKALRERVVVNEHGRRKTVTKLEAAVKQLTNKAAAGELKALQMLAALLRSAEDKQNDIGAAVDTLEDADEKVFLGILERLETEKDGSEQ